MKVILARLNGTSADESVLRGCLAISKISSGHIVAFFSPPDPRSSTVVIDEGISATEYQDTITELEQAWRQAASIAFHNFQKWRTGNNIPFAENPNRRGGPTAEWQQPDALATEAVNVAEFARTADILVSPAPALPEDEGLEAALFRSGRPVLLVPERCDPNKVDGRILIAWNGSVEASHAVAAALPLLTRAENVTVLTAPQNGVEPDLAEKLAAYLRWYGVHGTVLQPNGGWPDSISGVLSEAVRRTGADLLVMGAYTHSRMRERIFGGVTRHMLNKTEILVLMAH